MSSASLRHYHRNRDLIRLKRSTPAAKAKTALARAKYAAAYQSRIRAQRKAYRDRKRAEIAAYFEVNREAILARKRAKHRANRESVNAMRRAKYREDPARVIVAVRAWAAANKDKVRAKSRAWAAANPGKQRLLGVNKRARKRAAGGRLSHGLAERLLVLQRGCCACCRIPLAGDRSHLDHIMPLALGGRNEDGNIQLLCPPCNLAKHAKHPADFMRSRGYLL